MDSYWQAAIRDKAVSDFDAIAMHLYAEQFKDNPIYQQFCTLIGKRPDNVHTVNDIPFLPIAFFKSHLVQTGSWHPQTEFRSSGSTSNTTSRHLVKDLVWYQEVTDWGFKEVFGDPASWCWLALLPGYLDREGSSLITMAEQFIKGSAYAESGFFLRDHDLLIQTVNKLIDRQVPIMLLGVTFALLQLADRQLNWGNGVHIMETGGMKGMGPELIREQLHHRLKTGLGIQSVSSEYGMTELFSQAYTNDLGRFVPTPTMHVTTRDIHDPFAFPGYGRTGRLCMIDLANYATQAFIQTDDLGRVYPDGHFDVLGRMDGSDLRGCNLLIGEL
ncbi:MAG: acyl transferase [Saprospiraceae bacterium]|nr:acyl transferase [Saprospiraceae bacterium]